MPSYKLLFSHREMVADLVRGLVREDWVAGLDFDTFLADLIEPGLPKQLRHWQPQIRYLLLDERRYAEAALAGLRNVAAALFRLENSRAPDDIERVVTSLVD